MIYPLVTDLAAYGVPVAVTCRVLGFSKQGYYRWRASPVSERDWIVAHLVNAALDIHADDPAFGYRFIADELPGKGITAGENRVQRLCRDHGIWSVFSKKRGLNRRPGPPVHDDLVERDSTAAAANELWLTDITEHPTVEGKLYLCAVKDVYSGRIVGYSMDSRMKSSLAVAALENAAPARNPAGTVVHSDRGSQFRSRRFVESLRHHGLTGSMGRVGVGASADNAAMEAFFSLLQKNILDRQRWLTRQDLRLAITTWIERTYHRRRRQRRLGKLTPIEYETINRTALTAAQEPESTQAGAVPYRIARAALTRLFEPGDRVGRALVGRLGAYAALRLATGAQLVYAIPEVTVEELSEALRRWAPRSTRRKT